MGPPSEPDEWIGPSSAALALGQCSEMTPEAAAADFPSIACRPLKLLSYTTRAEPSGREMITRLIDPVDPP